MSSENCRDNHYRKNDTNCGNGNVCCLINCLNLENKFGKCVDIQYCQYAYEMRLKYNNSDSVPMKDRRTIFKNREKCVDKHKTPSYSYCCVNENISENLVSHFVKDFEEFLPKECGQMDKIHKVSILMKNSKNNSIDHVCDGAIITER